MADGTCVILFDVDGTLLSTDGAGSAALSGVLEERYGTAAALKGMRLAGKTDRRIIREVLAEVLRRAPSQDEIDEIGRAYVERLPEALAERTLQVYPGVPEILAALAARGARLGLGTGNLEPAARKKLEAAGLWDRFAFGGFGSDAEDRGEVLRIALERAEALYGPARERWVVGDTAYDVEAARSVGARVLAVGTGFEAREVLQAARPDVFLPDLAETERVLSCILGG